MQDTDKTMEQLIEELNALRIQLEAFKGSESKFLDTEKTFRESELKFRTVADFTYDWEYWIASDGSLKYISPSCERITGYRRDEFLHNPKLISEIVHPEDQSIFSDHYATIDSVAPDSVDFRIVTRTGEERWIEHYCQPVFGEDGEWLGRRVSNRDITDRKQAELALQEAEKRYKSFSSMIRLMCDNMPDLIWAKDLDGKFVFVNRAVCEKLLGASDTEEPIGETDMYFADRMRKENLQDPNYSTFGEVCADSDSVVLSTVKSGRFDEFGNVKGEFLYLDVHKAPFLDEDGTLIGIVGCGRVVTAEREAEAERRQIAEALRNSEQTLKTILSTSPVGITLFKDRQFIWINEFGLNMFGYQNEKELIGQSTRIFYPSEDDFERAERELYTGLETGRVAETQTKHLRKDGSVIDVRIRIKLIDPSSPGNLAIAIITDITDELRAEQEKEALQTQFLQAQKMEAVGNLAGGIAHDFNNLLQVVLGFSEVMLRQKKEGETDYSRIQKIYNAGKRGADLVKSLMTFSRRAEPMLRPYDLNHEVLQVQDLLSRTIPKTVKVDLHLAGDLESILADPSQIGQILMNLAVNARDAMPDGGTLTFRTANVILDEEYCRDHLEVKPGRHVLLAVSDTGQGMDKECLGHIFEPFFTTKGVGKGTGLGLATVYGIVKQHNGHIMCSSEPGHGTTFKIYLPAIQTNKELETATFETAIPCGTEIVLLVDDEEDLRDLGATLLNSFGYKVITAGNGQEALEIYLMEKDGISLVILDLIMPEMDGLRCLVEILRIDPNAKVIIASGYSESGPASGAIAGGAKGFVRKPYNMRQLLTTVREVLDED